MRPLSAPRQLRDRVRDSRVFALLREAREEDLGIALLALSAQQLLCTAPLAVAMAAVGKRATGVSIADVLTHVLHLDGPAETIINHSFAGSPHVSLGALVINLLIAIGFGVGVAASLQRGLELIWHLPRAAVVPSALRQAAWAVALPVLIVAIVAIGRGTHLARTATTLVVIVGFVAQLALVSVFGWWTQRLLLAGRVRWHRLWPSVALFIVALAILLLLARLLISGQLIAAHRAYGDVGLLIVLSAWVGVATTATMSALTLGSWLRP